jgi:hypothetical protein
MRAWASIAAVAFLVLLAPATAASRLVVRVQGASSPLISTACFLRLRQRVVGGGSTTYCLKTFHGRPGPDATLRDSGVMTFALPFGTIRAAVDIVERFAHDGAHAGQSLTGTITGGSGRYARVKGMITGGGQVVERPPGHVAQSDLRFVLTLRP